MAAKKVDTQIDVLKVDHRTIEMCIVGETPLIHNRMSQKVLQELLMPKGRKTAAEKASNLKHDPLAEYRSSPYTSLNDDSPTLIQHLSSAIKGSLRSAAVDLPGSSKAQIGRLTWVNGERIDIYGIPQMMMSVTRSADMARTPDVRTRAIMPQWACRVSVSFVSPILKETAVINLLASAGITQGLGDWRPEKGKGSYGQYRICDETDPEYLMILERGGRAAQVEALENPEFYDDETQTLFDWFQVESKRRGFKSVS